LRLEVSAEAAKIERSTSGMVNLAGANAQMTSFGNAATQAGATSAAAMAKAEKAGEALSRQMERQIQTFGMSRAAAAALKAEQNGLTELAERLRSQEANLAAMRQKAAAATEADAAAVRDAAAAYQTFEAVAKQRMATYRQQQATEAATANQVAAVRARADAEAAVNAQLLEQSRIESTLQRTTGLGRVSATNAGATYSALAAKAAEDEAHAQTAAAAATRELSIATRAFSSSGAIGTAATGLSAGVAGLGQSSQAARIEMMEMTHIARSMTEQIAMGVNPMRALAMESSRFLTALQYGGGGLSGFVASFANMLGIIKVVQNAELAEAAASTGAQAAAIAGLAARIKETIAAGEVEIELALAAQRVATTSVEEAVASARLTAAHEAQTISATQLAIAENALAVAQGRASEAAAASKAATVTTIGGAGIALIGFATVAGVAFGAIKQLQNQIKDDGTLTRYRDNLGLTHKEMLQLSDGVEKAGGKIKELGDVTVTFGDVMHGVWQEISKEASSGGAWDSFKGGASSAFNVILDAWDKTSAALTAGLWTIADIAKDVFNYVGQAIGQGFYTGVNKAIDAINYLASTRTGNAGDNMNIIPHVEGGKPIKDLVKLIQKQADDNYALALGSEPSRLRRDQIAAEQSAKPHGRRKPTRSRPTAHQRSPSRRPRPWRSARSNSMLRSRDSWRSPLRTRSAMRRR
jgi:hypothetical protein